MRPLFLLLLATAIFCAACGSSEQSTNGGAQPSTTTRPAQPANDAPPTAVAHGGQPTAAGQGAPDTSALDKKIEQAEAKAKAAGASAADRNAAAAAYVERGNLFYNAGKPTLYKFALRDFRLALRYDATNAEARAKQDQIVQIYQQMGRPVPELGNEP